MNNATKNTYVRIIESVFHEAKQIFVRKKKKVITFTTEYIFIVETNYLTNPIIPLTVPKAPLKDYQPIQRIV